MKEKTLVTVLAILIVFVWMPRIADWLWQSHNPLLVLSSPQETSYDVAGDYLYDLARDAQSDINFRYRLKARGADFYIHCMNTRSHLGQCDDLFKTMATLAKTEPVPNYAYIDAFVKVDAKDIQSQYMWHRLAPYVIADNNRQKAWEANP